MVQKNIEEQNIGVEQEDIEGRTEKKGIEVQPEQKQTSTIETENVKPTEVEDQDQEEEEDGEEQEDIEENESTAGRIE